MMSSIVFSLEEDAHWMRQALLQAQLALAAGEVPVGAVLVQNGQCIAVGHNHAIATNDPTAHAEMMALKAAAGVNKNYRLKDSTLYVTLEPCAMCAMAALHARVERVVYGASDPKTGAAGSLLNIFSIPELNHHTNVTGGVLTKECSQLLKDFFAEKRKQKPTPLREDALRTPEDSFSCLAGLSQEQVLNAANGFNINDLAALKQLQLRYYFYPAFGTTQANGPSVSKGLCLLLHDADAFSDQYASAVMHLQKQGHALLIPDLIGFGRSDKPKRKGWHSIEAHAAYLCELVIQVLNEEEPQHGSEVEKIYYDKLSIVAPTVFSGLVMQLEQKLQEVGLKIQCEFNLIEKLPALSLQHTTAPYPNAGFSHGKEAFKQQLLKAQALPASTLKAVVYPNLSAYLNRID